jgi:hypothetical protein
MFTLDIRDPIKYIKAKKKKKKCKDCEGTNKIFFFFFGKDMTKYVKNKSQRIWNKAIRTNLVSIGERQGESTQTHQLYTIVSLTRQERGHIKNEQFKFEI